MPTAIEGLKQANPTLHEKLTKASQVYMNGDQGPFRCDHCDFWKAPDGCELVEGQIDPAGCCNSYQKKG